MAATKLKVKSPIVNVETLSSDFATSKTLTVGGATIPANIGEIWCWPSAACHWTPNGAATSTFTHAVAADEPFLIFHKHQATAQIIGDGGAIVLRIAYMRGAGRQDTSHTAQARPN